jgi:hypothetical protein
VDDFFGFVLKHWTSLRVRGIDQQNGLIEAGFAFTPEIHMRRAGSCSVWFDLGKDWMLTRRVFEAEDPADASCRTYRRFEVKESKLFDGVRMPTRFTEVTLASGRDLATPVGNLWETTAEDIKFGHVKKEDLEVVFLPGTLVRDEITGDKWSVGKSGEKIAYNVNVGERPNGPVTQSYPHSAFSSMQRLVLGIGLLLVIALVATFVWRRRTHRSCT